MDGTEEYHGKKNKIGSKRQRSRVFSYMLDLGLIYIYVNMHIYIDLG